MTSEQDATTVEAIFSIIGRDFDPARVSGILGVDHTSIWRPRHARLASRTDLANIAWEYSHGPEPHTNLEAPLRPILDLFFPISDKIHQALSEVHARASIACIIVIRSVPPAYILAPHSMQQMAAMGAEFSLDILDRRD